MKGELRPAGSDGGTVVNRCRTEAFCLSVSALILSISLFAFGCVLQPSPRNRPTPASCAWRDVSPADARGRLNLALGNLALALEQLRAVN